MSEIADNFLVQDEAAVAISTSYTDNSKEVYGKMDHYYGASGSAGAIYGKQEFYTDVPETPILMPAEESRKEEEERVVARAYEQAASRSVAISKLLPESVQTKKDERLWIEDQSSHNNYIQRSWKKMLTEEELKVKIPVLMTVSDPYEKNIDASSSKTATETMSKNDPVTMYDQTTIPEQDASRPIVAGKGVNNYEQFALINSSSTLDNVVVNPEVVDAMTDHGLRTAYGHLAEKNERKPFDDVSQMKQHLFMVNKMGFEQGQKNYTATHLVAPEARLLV